MSDSLGTAVLDTAVDLSGLAKGLDKAEAEAGDGADRMGARLKGALGAAVPLAATAAADGVAVLGAALFDASEQASAIKSALGDLPDDQIQKIADGAGLLSARYGVELPETLAAVRTLMQEFGVDSQTALDFVTRGFESGLNSSGDFLDTIGEYSNQFAGGGASAGQFFSTLQTGLASGVLGTDKAADAFKEFGIRLLDGSDATRQALEQLGLAELLDGLRNGTISVADAMPRVQDALRGVDDQIVQSQLGVALYGTQWEDLGASAVLAIDTAQTRTEDLAGSTDTASARLGSLGEIGPRVWQMLSTALIPVAERLLPIIEQHLPTFLRFVTLLSDVGVPVLVVALSILNLALTGLSALMAGDLSAAGRGLAYILDVTLGSAVRGVAGAVEWAVAMAGLQWELFVFGTRMRIQGILDWFFSLPERMAEAGRNWVAGLLLGIRMAWDGFLGSVRDLAGRFLAVFNSSLGNASPSKYARAAMRNFFAGGELGIGDMEPRLIGRVGDLGAATVGALTSLDQSRTSTANVTLNSYSNAPVSSVVSDYNMIKSTIGAGT